MATPVPASVSKGKAETYKEKEKEKDVRSSNIIAGKSVADAVRTSLGPRGMDKMFVEPKGEITITNDGATILKQLEVTHPTAKMMVEMSKAQDIEAGDGTTSVVVMCGSLLNAASQLLEKGVHPTQISESFRKARDKSIEVLTKMSKPVDLQDRESLIKAAVTSLSSKVVSQNSALLAPIAADAVMKVINPSAAINVDLRDVRVVKKLGGTIEDTEIVDGVILSQRASHKAGGVSRIEKAKIGLIQFQLSPPKTDMENNIIVNDYQQMDRILKEERNYLLNLCKQIKNTGCNVLLIQKSILRDATTEMSLHFLAKLKILVVQDIERDEIEFLSKALGCKPCASIDHFNESKLGTADLVEEVSTSDGRYVRITGIQVPAKAQKNKTVSILVRGSNKLMLDETERSLHDALCVIRSLVKKRYLIAGGGAAEIELAYQLSEHAKTLGGMDGYCIKGFAEALEIVPTTLAENAGLHPISIVTELRNRHAKGEYNAGINVKKGCVSNMLDEKVVQPLLVTTSALTLATETACMILKIDDIVTTR